MKKTNEELKKRSAKGKKSDQNKQVKQGNKSKTPAVNEQKKQNVSKTAGIGKKSPAPKKGHYQKNRPEKEHPVNISFLGGLNEIGKNMTLFEYDEDGIVVDCGMSFPDADLLGVDVVIPDFTAVVEKAKHIRGIVITHGHEDHIGGLPYLLKEVNIPIYGTKLTLALIASKLKEHGLENQVKLVEIAAGQTKRFGKIQVEFIRVNHSIPDSLALAIKTPAGTIVHTGDFKIDSTPIFGEMMDLTRLGVLGNEGVLALLCDSTNVERPGYTPTEKVVGESFANLFRKAEKKRIIVATFSSNLYRIYQIINAAVREHRKVALSGRSMVNFVSIASELGYIKIPDNVLIDIDEINQYPKSRVVIITTGSQGEPMSALTRMAFSEHRKVDVGKDDYIIISATPIPGNEKSVIRVINELMRKGCDVVYEKMYDVHTSGHACKEELKIVHSLLRPQFFIPVHGEQKHMQKHAQLAISLGMPKKNVLIADLGQTVSLTKSKMAVTGTVQAGRVLVDGLGVGDIGNVVLKDRQKLAQDGIVVVTAAVDTLAGMIVSGPEVTSRGFVFMKESEDLIDEIRDTATDVMEECLFKNSHDLNTLKKRVRDEVARTVNQRTRRSPMVMAVILEV